MTLAFSKKLSLLLVYSLPVLLITGPALPDVSISIIGLLFLIYAIYEKKIYIIKEKWVFIGLVFWFYLQISSLFAENISLSFRDSTIFLRILLIPIFIRYWLLIDEKNVNKLIIFILITILFISFDCIYQFINYHPSNGFGKDLFGIKPEFYGRLTGPFTELVPGSYVAKFSFISLLFFFTKFKENKNILSFFIIIYLTLCGFIVFISGERMAFATFFLGMFVAIILFNNYRYIFILSGLISILIIFITIKMHPIYNDYTVIESTPYHLGLKVEKKYDCPEKNKCKKIIKLQPKFKEVIYNFKESTYGEIYNLAFQMWVDHKITGIGSNNFTYLCKNDLRYSKIMKNYNCTTHPHNFYLQWLIENGIIGFALFVIFVFSLFTSTVKNLYSINNKISFITLSILFWPLMSTGSLLKNWHGIETFFIIGIILSLNNIRQKN